jgi:hypothetical protein
MGNCLFIGIFNDFEGTTDNLKSNVLLDFGGYIDLLKKFEPFGVTSKQYKYMYNKNKNDTKKEIEKIKDDCKDLNLDTIILYISSHGFFNDKDNIAGFYTFDPTTKKMEEMLISDVINTNIFDKTKYKNFLTILNACQVYSKETLNTNSIYFENTILVYPTTKGNVALSSPLTGGFFSQAFYEFINKYLNNEIVKHILKPTDKITSKEILFIIKSVFKIYNNIIDENINIYENELKKISNEDKIKEYKEIILLFQNLIPQIYTNSNVRKNHMDLLQGIYKYSKQTESVDFSISRIENISEKNFNMIIEYEDILRLISFYILKEKIIFNNRDELDMIREKIYNMLCTIFIDKVNMILNTDTFIQKQKDKILNYEELYLPFETNKSIPPKLLYDLINENLDNIKKNFQIILDNYQRDLIKKDISTKKIVQKYKLSKFFPKL